MTTWMLAAHPEWVVLDLALIHFPAAETRPRLGDRVVLVHATNPRQCLGFGEFKELIPRWTGANFEEGWVSLKAPEWGRSLRIADITRRRLEPSAPGTVWRLTPREAVKVAAYFRGRPRARSDEPDDAPSTKARAAGARGRRPESIDDERQSVAYSVGRLERLANPAHRNYQARLGRFLSARGVSPIWEQDFVDLRFRLGDRSYIGEIKVTGALRQDEAFRAALGQLLDYADAERVPPAGSVMLLDFALDERRLALATRLRITVVWERAKGDYEVLNPSVDVRLARLWGQRKAKRRGTGRR